MPSRNRRVLLLGFVGLALREMTAARRARAAAPAVLLAAGDIASCETSGDAKTAKVLDGEAGTIAMLGDGVQRDGTLQQYQDCYGPTWGRHKARTKPAIGNHEINVDPAGQCYWDYWGTAAAEPGKGWYSFDLGASWHVVVLNSNCALVDCGADSEQLDWLRADLAASNRPCVLAFWHIPLVSDANPFPDGRDESVRAFWDALYAAGASVVLNGHRHVYERFALLDPAGNLAPGRGLRQFVVGTGGFSHHDFLHDLPTSRERQNAEFGVLKLTLGDGIYDWEFLPAGRGVFRDTGSGVCISRGAV